ncbi:MAG: leucine-rich repeat domain-containing protein [Spirochaetia bacterium]|nr:leucine-rich repeat domain-containing protein [Spirochaetia bacterium]
MEKEIIVNDSGEVIIISDTVKIIPKNAFRRCTKVSKIIIPESVYKIEDGAFEDCISLIKLNIPKSVKCIGRRICSNCISLQAINVDPANANYYSEDGVLFDRNLKKLLYCPGKMPGNIEDCVYKVPDDIKIIGRFAFSDCHLLTKIIISDTVETIEEFAFSDYLRTCPGSTQKDLNTLNGPEIAEKLRNHLQELIIGMGVKKIEPDICKDCQELLFITIKTLSPPPLVQQENSKYFLFGSSIMPTVIHVPVGSIYKTEPIWKEYAERMIEDVK